MRNQTGRLPFEYAVDEKEAHVTAWGGLPLVAEVLSASGTVESIRRNVHLSDRAREFDEVSCATALVLMLAAGGDCLDDMETLRRDAALARLMGRRFPSADTTRQFLYGFHNEELIQKAEAERKAADRRAAIPEESAPLKGLGSVLREFVSAVQARWPVATATVDIDATIQESHKKEAKPHYLQGRGYQPVMAYWVEQGLVVLDEFRDGNVPAAMNSLDIIKRSLEALPAGVKKRQLRGDVALYNPRAVKWLLEQQVGFAIGARGKKQLKAACAAVPEEKWERVEERKDTIVDVAEVPYRPRGLKSAGPSLRYIAVRMTLRQRAILPEEGEVIYLPIVTNRDLPLVELVRWYWGKGGTIEHVHDVVKNELGGGVLPCGRFGANAAWFRLCVLTHNALSVVRKAGPKALEDARPKRLRFNLLAIPAIVAQHARRLWAQLAKQARHVGDLITARETIWAIDWATRCAPILPD